MFSVIVPVYNAASTLERCVESILNSQRKDLQIILIEDRSKDNSWQICCTLAEKYSCITALQNDRNRGVSYTRNRGLDAAIGEYLLFVDSDDWVEPEWSSALLDELQILSHRLRFVKTNSMGNNNLPIECFCPKLLKQYLI